MTVSELIEILQRYDPTTLVTVNTLGYHLGIFPAADVVEGTRLDPAPDGETYSCVIIEPSKWIG